MKRRFKKEVVIGGVSGRDLDTIVEGVISQAESEDMVDETKAVLHRVIVELVLKYPNSKPLHEICE